MPYPQGRGETSALMGLLALVLGFADLVMRPTPAAAAGTDALVLVNSHSARYVDFQHLIQPYLDNFGFPYVVQDIATNPPTQGTTNYAVIIIGHSQLDTNFTYLNIWAQASICLAVANGTGLVSFDNDLSSGGAPRYPFVQEIFGFGYGPSAAATDVSLPPTEGASQMHYITARHPTNDLITFRSSLTMGGITVPAGGTILALAGGKPMVSIHRYGQGRAVQWGSYDWMVSTVLGPVDGLDDLVWRGVVWAARKPLVMRGMPNLVTMRVDDVSGPLWWVPLANEVGFKPFLGLMLNDISEATAADLRGLVTNGNATTSIHSFGSGTMFYFDHQRGTNYSDVVQSNYFYAGTQWHLSHGIPISKVCATHYSEIGTNAFGGLKDWGVEFVPIEIVPGAIEYSPPYAPWLVAGPYRLYETPQQGRTKWPTYYADWLTVPGHPELSGQFFNVYSEVRDVGSCNEWCPDNNDIAGSIDRGTRMLKRALDSMVMATAFTHEWYIHPTPCCGSTTITTNNWRAILQAITNNLAPYQPSYVTLDYASQYVRATRTSRLVSAEYDPVSGLVTAAFSGKTDLDTTVYTYLGQDSSISNNVATLPVFSGAITSVVATLPLQLMPPSIVVDPANQTAGAGMTVSFSAFTSGTAPFGYQWQFNGSNIVGATGTNLTLAAIQPADSGSYTVVVTNPVGSFTSSAAVLTVVSQLVLLNPRTSTNGAFTFTVSGKPGLIYAIEVTTNLHEWTSVAALSNSTGQVDFTDSTSSNSVSRCYRARVVH